MLASKVYSILKE